MPAAPPSITLVSPHSSVTFGHGALLLAAVEPAVASGAVTFIATGPDGPVTLGTAPVDWGQALLAPTFGQFGSYEIVARYSGNYPAMTSPPGSMEVMGWWRQLAISEVRPSGPAGAGDSYLELTNLGAPVPLAGFVIESTSEIDLGDTAATLPTNGSFLIAGPAFSLTGVATPDLVVPEIGTGGWQVRAPDQSRTITDKVGPASGYHTGRGFPEVAGLPDEQYAFVRARKEGRPDLRDNNATDVGLVSTAGAAIGGVASMLGSPSPAGLTDLPQRNAVLRSSLLDPSALASAEPNRSYRRGSPGRLVVRRTITNTGSEPVTSARARITALSQTRGLRRPVGRQPDVPAQLRVVAPEDGPTTQVDARTRGMTPVHNLTPEPPSTSPLGGGMNSTLALPLPAGGLAPGESIDVAFSFEVDASGLFWFSYDIEARS